MTLSEETVLPWYFPKVSTFWLRITYFSISLRNFKLRSRMKCWIQIFWCSYMNEVSDLRTKFIKWSLFCQFMIVVSKLITEDLQAKRKPHWLPLAVAHVSSTTWEDGERFLIKISINLWYLLIYFLQKQPLCIWCSRKKCLFLLRLIIKRGRLPWADPAGYCGFRAGAKKGEPDSVFVLLAEPQMICSVLLTSNWRLQQSSRWSMDSTRKLGQEHIRML